MTRYIDPSSPDDMTGDRQQIKRDKAVADEVARQTLFSGESTYNGSPAALRRMAARAGRPLPNTTKGDE